MNGYMSTNMGDITVDKDVIAQYAGSSAVECFGVVGMASISVKDGFAKLLKKERLTNGVNVTVENNQIIIDLHIIVSYGVSISAVADNLIDNVKYKVEEFAGLEVAKINIYVEGVRVID
ncbi:MAG: Asp23/Gls24 family envelope stress response protein [Lachnospiraceae bacterium]|nr:Asp23/Gls24 family envelope stress response protein [Lachnospiraceae bacterium]